MRVLAGLVGSDRAALPFVALVSPSIRELYGERALSLNGFLKAEGAASVHPVDSGIAEFARLCALAIKERGPGFHILSACPKTLSFLESDFPAFRAGVLAVPSPMALRARSALVEGGLDGSGFALAVTPCRYKKLEAKAPRSGFMVVQLDELLSAASAAGIDPLAFPAAPYDEAVPRADLSCHIAAEVVRELSALSVPARAVKLDGAEDAAAFLSGFRAGQETIVAEITFCKGGCAVPPDDQEGA
jgi:hypothetical protein